MTTHAEQLIARSRREDRTVSEYPMTAAEFDRMYDDLLVECHDDCDPLEISGEGLSGHPAVPLQTEFWGEGWRVALVRPVR